MLRRRVRIYAVCKYKSQIPILHRKPIRLLLLVRYMPLTSLFSRIFWRFVTLHESSPVRQQFLEYYKLGFIKQILYDFFSLHHFYSILYYSVTHVRWDINLQNIQSLVLLLIFYVHRLVVQGSGSAKKKRYTHEKPLLQKI